VALRGRALIWIKSLWRSFWHTRGMTPAALLDTPVVAPGAAMSAAAPLWAALDDPLEWPAFGSALYAAGTLWESHMVVQGMHCAACALTVEQALQALPGVHSARVSAASQRVSLRWEPARVLPSAWLAAVQRAGYTLVPANDVFAAEQRRLEQRAALWRWAVAGLCMMQVMMYAYPAYTAAPGDISAEAAQLLRWASWVLSLPVLLFSCQPFFASAWRDLRQGRIGMDLPVALGIGATFALSTVGTLEPAGPFGREVYFDSLTMFVFFLLSGRWLELRLRARTASALDAVFNRLPDSVQRQCADGSYAHIAARRVRAGDVLRVQVGEAFVADAQVLEGASAVDEALLTGESQALARGVGDTVLAGSHNLGATLRVRVTRVGPDTRYAQILTLMASAATDKPQMARVADRLAKPFLWGVMLAAGAAAAWWWPTDPGHALMVAVAVLVVTCPCALSLATPAAMLAAAGRLAGAGVLVRRMQALETLARVDTVVFDKTGTLSSDTLRVQQIQTRDGLAPSEALAWADALAAHSRHPAARALHRTAREPAHGALATHWRCDAVQETPGHGMQGSVQGLHGQGAKLLHLGSASFCDLPAHQSDTSHVLLRDEQGWAATFTLTEVLRPDAQACVRALSDLGVQVHMLSGDAPVAVARAAAQLGIGSAQARCTPQDKLAALRQMQAQGRTVAMVGDGLNDAPVLAGAHVSFAFGQATAMAQSQADFVVLGERLLAVSETVALARKTMRVVWQNLVWALAYNAACVPLAVAGLLPAWLAGLGMAGSSLLVVANAARLAGRARATPSAQAQDSLTSAQAPHYPLSTNAQVA